MAARVASRPDELLLAFCLLSLITFAHSRRHPGSLALRIISLILFGAGLLSKETAIVLPVVLMAWDIWIVGASARASAVRTLPFWMLSGLYFIVRWIVRGSAAQMSYWGGSPWVTFLTMLTVLPRYARTAIVPVGLNVDPYTAIVRSATDARVLFALVFVTGIICLATALARRSRRARLLLAWGVAAMLPVSNLLPLRALEADRFLYMPLVALHIGLAALIAERHRQRLACILMVLMFQAALTVARASEWRTEYTLWRDAVPKSPVSSTSLTNLAMAEWDAGARASAVRLFQKAQTIHPSQIGVHRNLAKALQQMDRLTEARDAWREAARLNPNDHGVLAELGSVCLATGELKEAVHWLDAAAKLPEADARTHFNLGVALTRLGDSPSAIRAFERVVGIDPSHAAAHLNLAALHLAVGDVTKAGLHARRAQSLGRKLPGAMKKALGGL